MNDISVRVMRVLTAIGLCDEVGNETYAANEKTHFKILAGSIAAEKHQYVILGLQKFTAEHETNPLQF